MRETVLSNLEGLRLAQTSMERDHFIAVIMEQFDVLYNRTEKLETVIQLLLDCVDYTNNSCRLNDMVGAVLPSQIIEKARSALTK
jgi:hypothetical protein